MAMRRFIGLLGFLCAFITPPPPTNRTSSSFTPTSTTSVRSAATGPSCRPTRPSFGARGLPSRLPNLDWLARNGAICDRFYATSPLARRRARSLVSGRYPQNAGTIGNNDLLRDDVITFAEALRRRGYDTGYAGKWHLDGDPWPGWAPRRKFGFEDNRYMFNRGHWKKLGRDPRRSPRRHR